MELSHFAARDIDGVRLDMTVAEVASLFDGKLKRLVGPSFEANKGNTTYYFEFSVRGHLYMIKATQDLGRFAPDSAFMDALGARLAKKYNVHGKFYAGTADWDYSEPTGHETIPWLPTESLSVSVSPDFTGPTTLDMRLRDFRIMRRDQRLLNVGPASAARKAVHF